MQFEPTKPVKRGLNIVSGVPPETKPICGAPPGKYRIRFRQFHAAQLFVKTAAGIRVFMLEDKGDAWLARGDLHQGRNERHLRCRAWLPGAAIRRFKTFQFV